jgi:hypothetical protein
VQWFDALCVHLEKLNERFALDDSGFFLAPDGWLDGWMEGQPLFPFFLFLREAIPRRFPLRRFSAVIKTASYYFRKTWLLSSQNPAIFALTLLSIRGFSIHPYTDSKREREKEREREYR